MIRRIILLGSLLALVFSGCKKDNSSTNYTQNLLAAYSNTLAEDMFDDVFLILFQSFYDTSLHNQGYKKIFAADVFYNEIEPDSIRVHIDYPSWNQLCPDGLYRKNDILATISLPFTDTSGRAQIVFEGYEVENHQITGHFTLELASWAGEGAYAYQLLADNTGINLADTVNIIQWNCEKLFIWNQGKETPQEFQDDIFSVTGTTSGISYAGKAFTTSVTSEILIGRTCPWQQNGALEISTPGLVCKTGKIVYDSTNCQSFFRMYFNGILFYHDLMLVYRPGPTP